MYPVHCKAHKTKDYDKGKNREDITASRIDKPVKSKTAKHSYKPGQVFPAIKGRSLPEGMGSLGTRAFHLPAKVGNLELESICAQLDSEADITLILEEFWKSMTDAPCLHEGLRMKLYELTGGAKVLGYIKTELFVLMWDELIISFKLKAYVICNINLPLLLGEDFQTTYELGLTRYALGHCD